jgi:hypothetical protein
MASSDTKTALAQDLSEAITDLQTALQHAGDATARIKNLVPRIGAVNALLDEIESVLQAGRREIGTQPTLPESFTRPTLVVSESPEPATTAPAEPEPDPEPQPQPKPSDGELICFRLEFQSNGGPLDLRAVDDAVGEHPAVRDVALLDYDGRNATLKVWIINSASPADVQQSLTDRASQLFASSGDVTIVALEDAA